MLNKANIEEIFERLKQENPNPMSELVAHNDFTFAIAVLLSAQTTDKMVNKVTKELFEVADTPGKMLMLGIDKLKEYIHPLGFFNNKAKNVIALSKVLIEEYNSLIPSTRDELGTLPGIGRKSANVIANRLFGADTIAVDTHVLRVSRRLGLSQATDPVTVEKDLLNVVPQKFHKNASDWLVLHGRYVCTAKKPKCAECCLFDLCEKVNEKVI
ncbi:MAG: endonuclease III [Alphaproteobacteria bacterium]|nr:endonuclease III [Alphaproteobacteria bacterium]